MLWKLDRGAVSGCTDCSCSCRMERPWPGRACCVRPLQQAVLLNSFQAVMDFGVGDLVDLANTAGSLLGRVGQVLAGPAASWTASPFRLWGAPDRSL